MSASPPSCLSSPIFSLLAGPAALPADAAAAAAAAGEVDGDDEDYWW